ncbi:MAG: hydroxyacylglutathione hydrolase [Myxococcota bacterium]
MHVVTQRLDPIVTDTLEVHRVPAATDNLVWVVVDRATGDAAIVDGPSAAEVLPYVEARGIRVVAVWNTHTHGDHVGLNRDLAKRGLLPARVVGPAGAAADVPGLTDPVDQGDRVTLGQTVATVWRTDGHLKGHVSFVVDGFVFCGDTLFAGGCGRVLGGTHAELFDSLLRLAELPGDTRVCCAHEYTQDNLRFAWSVEPGNAALRDRIRQVWAIRSAGGCAVPSTIEVERATNPFLRPGAPEIRAVVGDGSALAAFTALRDRKDQGAYKALGDGPLAGLLQGEP